MKQREHYSDFGKALARFAGENGVRTQFDLASRLGASTTTLNNIFLGVVGPDPEFIEAVIQEFPDSAKAQRKRLYVAALDAAGWDRVKGMI